MSITVARQQALAMFEQEGLPQTTHEDWRYTDVSRFAALLDGDQAEVSLDAEDAAISGLDAYRVVLHNGVFQADDSELPNGVKMRSLANILAEPSADADQQLEKLFQIDGKEPLFNGLMALNAARACDGVALCVADGVILDKPLYILHVGNKTSHIRHAFSLGKQSSVEIIEHFVGQEHARALSNISSNVILHDGASCEHYRLQLEGEKQCHFSRVEVKQYRDSSYTLHAIELGAALSRSDVVVDLAGQGASCALHGLFVLAGRQHVDHHTHVDHHAPHCTSKENYRTVLDGRSHGVFNGKVVVHKGAIKTDSAQSNANLLLSTKAEVDTKPELEIYNDDVKCAHGATVGQLDEAQLFYLRSRGLSEAEAKEVLTFAFADEVLTAMGNGVVRSFIEQKAFSKLPHSTGLDGLLG